MEQQKVLVNISAIGNVEIEAQGFTGCGCTEKTKNLEQLFSGNGANSETALKSEYYEQGQTETVEIQNG